MHTLQLEAVCVTQEVECNQSFHKHSCFCHLFKLTACAALFLHHRHTNGAMKASGACFAQGHFDKLTEGVRD